MLVRGHGVGAFWDFVTLALTLFGSSDVTRRVCNAVLYGTFHLFRADADGTRADYYFRPDGRY